MSPKQEKAHFANLLKACREKSGLNISELASMIHRSRSLISRAQNPDHAYIPPPDVFDKISSVLKEYECPADLLAQLEETWMNCRQENNKNMGEKTLNPSLHQDIEDLLYRYRDDQNTQNAFGDSVQVLIAAYRDMHLADGQMNDGLHDFAKDGLETLLISLEPTFTEVINRIKIRVLLRLALAYRYLGKGEEALKNELTEAIELVRVIGAKEREIHANLLLSKGNFQRRLGHLESAIDTYELAGTNFGLLPDWNSRRLGLAKIQRKIGGTLLFRGEALLAEEHLRRSIRICEELRNEKERLKGEQHRAWALSLLGHYDQAMQIHLEVLEELISLNTSPVNIAKAKRYYADTLRMCREFDLAITIYNEARQDFRSYTGPLTSEEGKLLRGPILLGLGQTYRQIGRYLESESNLLRSEDVNQDDPFFLARTHNELGKLALQRNDFEKAVSYFNKALQSFSEQKNSYYITALRINLSELYYSMGKYDDAIKIAEDSLENTRGNDNLRVHRMRCFLLLGHIKLKLSMGNDILASYFEALRIANEDLQNSYLFQEALLQIKKQILQYEPEQRDQIIREFSSWQERIGTTNVTKSFFDDWITGL